MGEPSDIKAGGMAPTEGGGAAAPADQGDGPAARGWWARSWVGRHWRGELPMGEAYWINGFLLNVVLGLLAFGLDCLMDDKYYDKVDVVGTVFWLAFLSLFEKWEMAWGCWGHLDACLDGGVHPKGLHADVAWALFAFTSMVTVWQIVGIWRSVVRSVGQRLPDGRRVGGTFWPTVTLLLMMWWVFRWVLQLPPVLFE